MSGIPVSKSLLTSFAQANQTGDLRFILVQIVNDELTDITTYPASPSLENDFDAVPTVLGSSASFVLLRLEAEKWVLLANVPDATPSRQRMMYASSQQILKRQLGASCFTRDIFGTQPDDFNYAAYELSIKGDDSSALLTKAEVESKAELVETSLSANHSTGASTLSLPLSHAAQAALRSLASRDVNFVLIRIDDKSETMELDCAKNIALSTLEAAVPNAVPRYLLVRLGDDVIFVYSCPDASPVRGRMVYSTSKAAFALMTKELGVDIKKKLEVRDSSELSESSLRTELGSGESGATHHSTQIFSKPARPGRGAARLI